MSAHTAKQCFVENRNRFGNAHQNPEEFNLYNGLASLAETISDLERKLQAIHSDVQYIKQHMD